MKTREIFFNRSINLKQATVSVSIGINVSISF